MQVHESVIELIGNTPLVRLGRLSEGFAPTILAKLESFNPGGSAKDRIALRMVEAAEAAGRLKPGGTIVEPTSGNTGVGLALVAQQKGYSCIFTCPDKVSQDKISVLLAYGAEVVVCPATAPPDHPDFYRNVAERLARETPNAFRPDQYSNPDNPASHYHRTGPEVWEQTDGRITHLVAGVGTGGTISGTGRYLKEKGNVTVIGADPVGSVYTGGGGRPYLVEGVGQPSIPEAFDSLVPDEILAISDRDSIQVTRRLAREEGILTGGSGGMAVAAALQVAAKCSADDVIVVVIPDSGRGYLSKIFNDDWLIQLGFEEEPGEGLRFGDLAGHGLVAVHPQESIAGAIKTMRTNGLSHVLVSAATPPIRFAEIVGSLSERGLARRIARGKVSSADAVADHMEPPLPSVGRGQHLTHLPDAAVVLDHGMPLQVVSSRSLFLGEI